MLSKSSPTRQVLSPFPSHCYLWAVVLLAVSELRSQAEPHPRAIGAPYPGQPYDQRLDIVPPEKIPSAAPRSPEEALKSFKLAPGIRLELAASEPLIQDPVAMAFGADGRMWVVEMRGYMQDIDGSNEEAPIGRVSVLSDTNGDGHYDDAKIFVDGLVMPRALILVADGVLVGARPELAFWRDTDGDGRADQKTVVATDYGVLIDPKRPGLSNAENEPNGLYRSHDNWIYSANYPKKFRYVDGHWQSAASPLRGQWGLSQDDYGRFFFSRNSVPVQTAIINPRYAARNPHYPDLMGAVVPIFASNEVWPGRVTPGALRAYMPGRLRPDGTLWRSRSSCGPWYYGGDLLPQFRGDLFVGEPVGNLVRREVLTAAKGTLRSRNPYERSEFITSDDERFRPVNFATGPDGALYIVDLYRGFVVHSLQHSFYIRRQIRERNLAQPIHLGRIYRVVPSDRPAPRASRLPTLTPAQWVERLSHANSWWRETAQRVLVERRDAAVVPALRRVALSGEQPLGRLHALWTLDGIGAIDRAVILDSLDDSSPVVRAAAIRLAEPLLENGERGELLARLLRLAEDTVPEVQTQAVLTLGVVDDAPLQRNLAKVVRNCPDNTFLAEAFYTGLAKREWEVLQFAVNEARWAPDDAAANRLVTGLARGVYRSRDLPAIERMLALAAEQVSSARPRATAILEGVKLAAGKSKRGPRLAREPAGWSRLADDPVLGPEIAKLTTAITWPGKAGVPELEAIQALTAAQQVRFEQGRTLFTAICATCHQQSGRGLEAVAPPLLDSEWLLGEPGPLVRIVLHGKLGPRAKINVAPSGDMPPFGALADEQIAAILTYLRREWGHTAAPIETPQVVSIRAATQGRTDGWSQEELNELR